MFSENYHFKHFFVVLVSFYFFSLVKELLTKICRIFEITDNEVVKITFFVFSSEKY